MSIDRPASAARRRPTRDRHDPVSQLEREWERLERGPLSRALCRWRPRQPPLARFHEGRQLLRFLQSAPAGETNAPLLSLLALAREERPLLALSPKQLARRGLAHEQLLAGRLLLQAILPALKAQAERIRHRHGDRDEIWELQLFYAWEAICSYPLERRHRRVAANLVLQVLHQTTRHLRDDERRRALASGYAASPRHSDHTPDARPAPLAPALAAGVLAASDAELILQTRLDGVSLRLAAQSRGVGYHALRQRRQRAEQRLRSFLLADGDVSNRPVSDLTSSRDDQPARAA